MAERRLPKETVAGKAESPPSRVTPKQFEDTPEFRRFREGMKKLLQVSKAELDRRVERAKNSQQQEPKHRRDS